MTDITSFSYSVIVPFRALREYDQSTAEGRLRRGLEAHERDVELLDALVDKAIEERERKRTRIRHLRGALREGKGS